MPFLAEHNDELVIPEGVDDGIDLACPECGERMRARGPFKDGTARHFYHLTSTDCAGGESDKHRKWKSLAVSGLRQHFDTTTSQCRPEVALDTSQTLTATDSRRADALLSFSESNPFFGEGIIVEVQWQNKGKDVRATTHDYLALGYSVYWAGPDDFADDRFLVDRMETAFNDRVDDAFTPYYSYPPCGIAESKLNDGMLNYALTQRSEKVIAYSRPFPSRDHDWVTRMGTICHRCGVERYTVSALNQTIYVFEPGETDPRDLEWTVRGEEPTDHEHKWLGLRSGTDGEILECDCGAKRTHTDGSVVIDHGPNATWDISVPKPPRENDGF